MKELSEVSSQKGIEPDEIRHHLNEYEQEGVTFEGFKKAVLFLLPNLSTS